MDKSKKKILIVEDEQGIRDLIRIGLGEESYDVCEAEDGFGIGNVLNRCAPDLIILDLKLPVTDGFTVLENIQKFFLERGKNPPKVLVCSAFMDENTIAQLKGMPVNDWLVKPFQIDELKKKIDKLFS